MNGFLRENHWHGPIMTLLDMLSLLDVFDQFTDPPWLILGLVTCNHLNHYKAVEKALYGQQFPLPN